MITDIHPLCEQRLAAWRPGLPFPCHACGVADCLEKRLVCASCAARMDMMDSMRLVSAATRILTANQIDLFGS